MQVDRSPSPPAIMSAGQSPPTPKELEGWTGLMAARPNSQPSCDKATDYATRRVNEATHGLQDMHTQITISGKSGNGLLPQIIKIGNAAQIIEQNALDKLPPGVAKQAKNALDVARSDLNHVNFSPVDQGLNFLINGKAIPSEITDSKHEVFDALTRFEPNIGQCNPQK